MKAARFLLIALLVGFSLLLSTRAMAQATCVPFGTCSSDNTKPNARDPYSSKTWQLFTIPTSPLNDHIYLTNDDVESHVRRAMDTYNSLDFAIPYDYLSRTPADDTFQWGWVALSDLASNPNRRTGVPAAAMGLNYTNCMITVSIGMFAYNPSDGVRLMCWTGNWCDPPWCASPACGDTTNLDYQAAAVHEYGHALGLGHSSTSGATMAASMFPQDSVGRFLLACEANRVAGYYHDNNPAATVTSYSVTRNGGGITLSWQAEQELSTDHYIIEQGATETGPFTALMNVPVNGTGVYNVPIPNGTSGIYRLSEVETDGDVWPLKSEPDADPGTLPQFVQESINFDSTLTALVQNQAHAQVNASGPTQFYIYCPDSMRTDFQSMADLHSSYDVPTEVVTYESLGGPSGVKAHIAAHLPNGGWILKVGDAWDGRDLAGQLWAKNPALYVGNGFTMPTWPDQPQLNLAPLTYLREYAHQSVSINYWSPYGALPWTDVDFNNDGRPDANYYLGYAPVSNRTEAQVFIAKSIQQIFTYPSQPANMMSPVVMMTYGRNYGSNSGAKALAMASRLVQNLHDVSPYLSVTGITTSDANPLTTTQRNAALKARFDSGMSSCTFVSTVSQRYELGAYAHVDIPGYYFDVNALALNGIQCFGIGVTCEMGFSRIEDPAYGTPVTERLLFVPSRGFWGYFGPDRGSLQGGNERLGKIFHRRQYSTPLGAMPPTVGELATQTVIEGAAFKPDSLLAISYLLVGNPRGRIQAPSQAVVSVGPQSITDEPLRLAPNPSRGPAQLSFSLAKATLVDLSVYDVAGRKVTTIVRSTLPLGPHSFSWNGYNRDGVRASSGIYFIRLQVGQRQTQQALTLLH